MKKITALLIVLSIFISIVSPLSALADDGVVNEEGNTTETVTLNEEKDTLDDGEITEETEKNPSIAVTEKLSIAQTKTATVKITFTDLLGNGVKSFKSSNTKVATVDSTGKVKALTPGTANITVTYSEETEDGTFTDTKTCAVTVTKFVPVKKIAFSADKIGGKIGSKKQLTVNFAPKSSTNKALKYTTSDKYVAKVSKTGVVKFTGPGKCKITAVSKDNPKAKDTIVIVSKGNKGWFKLGTRTYYINAKGNAVKGYKKIKGNYYYFNKKGVMVKKKWVYVKLHKKKYKLFFKKNGKQAQNVEKLIGKRSSYRVMVNCKTNCITVYAKHGKNGYIIPVRAIICSTGVGNCTIKGTFTIRRVGRWHELMGGVWGQWVSQISGNYLFHSAWYYAPRHKSLCVSEFNKLGRQASHGCVRLTVGDAKWIWSHCAGSKVKTYSAKWNGPLKKPAKPKCKVVSGDRGYDPSDPYFKK